MSDVGGALDVMCVGVVVCCYVGGVSACCAGCLVWLWVG